MLDLFEFPKPVIATINGAAVGFGVSSTLAMDVRICSTARRFGFVYSQRRIASEAASSWFWPRVVGVGQALEWMYSGRVFRAEEALAGRLVSEVVGPEDLLARAHEIAEQIVTQISAVSIAIIRRLVWRGWVCHLPRRWREWVAGEGWLHLHLLLAGEVAGRIFFEFEATTFATEEVACLFVNEVATGWVL